MKKWLLVLILLFTVSCQDAERQYYKSNSDVAIAQIRATTEANNRSAEITQVKITTQSNENIAQTNKESVLTIIFSVLAFAVLALCFFYGYRYYVLNVNLQNKQLDIEIMIIEERRELRKRLPSQQKTYSIVESSKQNIQKS